MSLIVISSPLFFTGEADLINQLFDAGMAIFHLRKPDTDKSNYTSLISHIATQYHDRVALHQFHDLCKDFPSIKRLHYPEQLRKKGLINVDGYTLSTSIHHLDDLNGLEGFDYTFYGPVFNSISKRGYTGLGKADLILPDKNSSIKIIGLGGIDYEKVQDIKLMGFDGVAVLGTIWKNRKLSVQNLKSLITKHKEHFN
jgi:thiamine-phosphate pyrophosphorylase